MSWRRGCVASYPLRGRFCHVSKTLRTHASPAQLPPYLSKHYERMRPRPASAVPLKHYGHVRRRPASAVSPKHYEHMRRPPASAVFPKHYGHMRRRPASAVSPKHYEHIRRRPASAVSLKHYEHIRPCAALSGKNSSRHAAHRPVRASTWFGGLQAHGRHNKVRCASRRAAPSKCCRFRSLRPQPGCGKRVYNVADSV